MKPVQFCTGFIYCTFSGKIEFQLETCQCDTDAPAHGHYMRKEVFVRDVRTGCMRQDIWTRVIIYAPH